MSARPGTSRPAGSMAARLVGRLVAIVVVVGGLAILPLLDVPTAGAFPGALSSPGTLQLLGLMLVFGALALTYDLLFGFTGLLSFGHALYFAIGVYTTDIALAHLGLSFLPAVGFAVAAGIVIPLAVGAVCLRVEGIAFAMVTLAFAQAASLAVSHDVFGVTGGDLGLGLPYQKVPGVFVGVFNTRNIYWLALVLLVVVYAAAWWLTNSPPGRVWQAIRENERRVEVLGLRPYGFKLMAFVLASVLATLCGIVYLLLVNGAQPGVTTPDFTLTLLVMVVLGGTGRLWGAVIGGVIYTYLDQRLGEFAASGTVQSLPKVASIPLSQPLFILGLLFVLFVLFVPGGVAGVVSRAPARMPFDQYWRSRHDRGGPGGAEVAGTPGPEPQRDPADVREGGDGE